MLDESRTDTRHAVDQRVAAHEVSWRNPNGCLCTPANDASRLLLPDESFTDIAYPVKADIDYEAFARGELSGGHAARGPKTNVHLILRNKTPGGDLVLDWLQKGAFEALQRKWLRALQLNVHTDSQEPRRIVEAYTFSFAYADHADDGSLVSISFSSRQGRKTELKDIRYALHGFLRQLVGICRTLPQLPGSLCRSSEPEMIANRLWHRSPVPLDELVLQ